MISCNKTHIGLLDYFSFHIEFAVLLDVVQKL